LPKLRDPAVLESEAQVGMVLDIADHICVIRGGHTPRLFLGTGLPCSPCPEHKMAMVIDSTSSVEKDADHGRQRCDIASSFRFRGVRPPRLQCYFRCDAMNKGLELSLPYSLDHRFRFINRAPRFFNLAKVRVRLRQQ
jgi:hypothetical protein